jgi:MFS family permease
MADERRPLLDSVTRSRLSRISAHSITTKKQDNPDYPIDHGYVAWMQVLGGFVLFANSWCVIHEKKVPRLICRRGLPNTFGVFQTHYVENMMPDQPAASIAWIGSIQLFFTTLGCLPGGFFIDRGYLKSLIAIGTILEVLGLILASFFTGFWPILFAQGVCMGIGSGLLALVPIAVLSMFFEKKRMLATGLASTGASVAGIAYTLAMRSLFLSAGFSWAVRIFALVLLATNAIAFCMMRLQRQYGSKGSNFGLHHFKDLPYSAFVCAFTLFVASSFVPFFFIQDYAISLGVDKDMAFSLLSIMNAANIFGRFMPNFIADRYAEISSSPSTINN